MQLHTHSSSLPGAAGLQLPWPLQRFESAGEEPADIAAGLGSERVLALWTDDPPAARAWGLPLRAEGLRLAAGDCAEADAQLLWLSAALPLRLAWLRERCEARGSRPLVVVGRGLRELDAVLAFEMGADEVFDAATVSPPLVAARLRALWRRLVQPQPVVAEPRELVVGNLRLVLAGRQVWLAGGRIAMTEGEFEVLWLLAGQAGRAVARSEILRRVRGLEDQPLDRSIDSRVYRIRHKLGDRGLRIRTVRHFGYALACLDGPAGVDGGRGRSLEAEATDGA